MSVHQRRFIGAHVNQAPDILFDKKGQPITVGDTIADLPDERLIGVITELHCYNQQDGIRFRVTITGGHNCFTVGKEEWTYAHNVRRISH